MCICKCKCVYICAYMFVHVCECMCVYIMGVYAYVCLSVCMCVCVSQTLFQREVKFSDERFQDFHDYYAGGHRKPIELCPTKLSMVSSGYQG